MMFRCRVCAAHQSQIASLQSEVVYLRSLVDRLKPAAPMNVGPTHLELESNAVLSGHQDQILVGAPDTEQQEIEDERARILSGNY